MKMHPEGLQPNIMAIIEPSPASPASPATLEPQRLPEAPRIPGAGLGFYTQENRGVVRA